MLKDLEIGTLWTETVWELNAIASYISFGLESYGSHVSQHSLIPHKTSTIRVLNQRIKHLPEKDTTPGNHGYQILIDARILDEEFVVVDYHRKRERLDELHLSTIMKNENGFQFIKKMTEEEADFWKHKQYCFRTDLLTYRGMYKNAIKLFPEYKESILSKVSYPSLLDFSDEGEDRFLEILNDSSLVIP